MQTVYEGTSMDGNNTNSNHGCHIFLDREISFHLSLSVSENGINSFVSQSEVLIPHFLGIGSFSPYICRTPDMEDKIWRIRSAYRKSSI